MSINKLNPFLQAKGVVTIGNTPIKIRVFGVHSNDQTDLNTLLHHLCVKLETSTENEIQAIQSAENEDAKKSILTAKLIGYDIQEALNECTDTCIIIKIANGQQITIDPRDIIAGQNNLQTLGLEAGKEFAKYGEQKPEVSLIQRFRSIISSILK